MKYLRLSAAIIVGLAIITLTTELIEFLVVKVYSGESVEALLNNENKYFDYRNNTVILISKMIYSLFAGVIAGYLISLIARKKTSIALYLVIVLQLIALVYAGFISEMKTTGPIWMWVGLMILIPLGVLIGNRMRLKQNNLK